LRLKFQNRIIHTQEFCNCCGDEDADDEFENLVLAKAAHNEDEDDKDNDNGEDKGEHISDEADDELFDEEEEELKDSFNDKFDLC
jgi:hypothetical protein